MENLKTQKDRVADLLELARDLAAEIMVKMRQAKIDEFSEDEHQDEFEELTLVPMIEEAFARAQTKDTGHE